MWALKHIVLSCCTLCSFFLFFLIVATAKKNKNGNMLKWLIIKTLKRSNVFSTYNCFTYLLTVAVHSSCIIMSFYYICYFFNISTNIFILIWLYAWIKMFYIHSILKLKSMCIVSLIFFYKQKWVILTLQW